MLRILPIISVLVFSLFTHGIKVSAKFSFTMWMDQVVKCGCNEGYELGNSWAYCSSGYPSTQHCKCEKSSCKSPADPKLVKMSGCQHNGPKGPEGGVSTQDCSTYSFDQTHWHYICHNPGGYTYICPADQPNFANTYITCHHCWYYN
ncbi:uncharacterized protein MELLADRAFT_106383 [Melampsora larici-populina 98AG31]|uniref:Secreted protein n=1 Tax=Melampsora larici-populina (strain 98AG31 / pathotype 3-4-7) TaxID=747676 RepID=F4RL73_MELLP|nr:uncharacterized protein MELLADRAFT_106383 [Melampsora larici-populina 98AG31]EGG06857.1 secreted protein [Melampsora larici-populina 98AG31]